MIRRGDVSKAATPKTHNTPRRGGTGGKANAQPLIDDYREPKSARKKACVVCF